MLCSHLPTRVVLPLAILAASCSSGGGIGPVLPSTGASPESPREVIVTRSGSQVPPSCRPAAVADIVMRFFSAIGRGDQEDLSALIAPEPRFQWYSVQGGGRNFVAYERWKALAYFRTRYQQQERLRLLTVNVSFDSGRSLGNVGYFLKRSARDLQGRLGGLYAGKGSIDCTDGTIIVWSMGREPGTPEDWGCPTPANWQVGQDVIACARGS